MNGSLNYLGYSIATVRYRYTEYVPIVNNGRRSNDPETIERDWDAVEDKELYDLDIDPWETVNVAEDSRSLLTPTLVFNLGKLRKF